MIDSPEELNSRPAEMTNWQICSCLDANKSKLDYLEKELKLIELFRNCGLKRVPDNRHCWPAESDTFDQSQPSERRPKAYRICSQLVR